MSPSCRNRIGAGVRSARMSLGMAVLLLGASGCGLSAYEEQMDREQKRIQAIDEANRLLDDPVEPPPLKETNPNVPPAGTNYLFFRPPWGIAAKYEAATRGELLHEYPPVNRNRSAWQRQRNTKETVFLNVFLAVAPATSKPEDWNQFANKVLQTFANPDPSSDAKVTVEPPGRPPLEFQTRSFTEPPPEPNRPATVYRAYFYRSPTYDVAIVYHLPQDQVKSADVTKTIDYSLKSLALGPEASTKLAQWQRSHPKK